MDEAPDDLGSGHTPGQRNGRSFSSRSLVVDKAQELLPPAPGDIISDTVDYVDLRYASPEVIIAQGGETAVAKNGKRSSLIWTDVWMLRAGRWQIVTSQDSRLPEPYKSW